MKTNLTEKRLKLNKNLSDRINNRILFKSKRDLSKVSSSDSTKYIMNAIEEKVIKDERDAVLILAPMLLEKLK